MTRDEAVKLLQARRSWTDDQYSDFDVRGWSFALRDVSYDDAVTALARAVKVTKKVAIFELCTELGINAPQRPAEYAPPDHARADPKAIPANSDRAVGIVQASVGAEWAARLERARIAGPEMLARLDRWTREDRKTSPFAAWVQTQLHPPEPESPDRPLSERQIDANPNPV
jgi:hypothetical protein